MDQQPNFDTIARYYDLLYADRADDLEMWLELTDPVRGPILEVGCGTGRVLIPLAQEGRRVTGIDISEVALDATKAKIAAGGFEKLAQVCLADMQTLNLPQKNFSFAFIPINTFMHCLTTTQQRHTLSALHRHLQTGGTLVIDLYHPNPEALLEADGRLLLTNQIVDDLTGNTVQWFVARHLEVDQQIQNVTFLLDEIGQDGILRRSTFSFPMRYLHRFELELLLHQTGFSVTEIYGDYDLSPFEAESPRMIFVAQKSAG